MLRSTIYTPVELCASGIMTSKIECVIKQAITTFSGSYTSKAFHDNLIKLKRNANELDARSIGLDFRLLRWDTYELNNNLDKLSGSSFIRRHQAPVTYIEVFEDENVSIGVFVLRDGAKIPLHDHPYMYGVLKVIYGKVKVQSYTPVDKDYSQLNDCNISAIKLAPIIVGETDDPCVLCPVEGNIHQVDTIDGPAAFVDILAPPYKTDIPEVGKRCCRYFKEVNISKDIKLAIVSDPRDYWSDTAPYTGPQFGIRFEPKT
ncbi:2-aminoethanethiol dioxygenase [Rhopalosiphum maidis]|uniref:2-aminoethanethiol dioxygenase n=1 Tax=Rhopalosiphum maidis TaxID=43146 RepID=UPI000F00C0F6|nr:2-aminoethanethiol dioxygenase [Rhopalosiphum maidis]